MPELSDGTESTGGVSNQLASLVPSFDPSKDELQMYQQKVQLVLSVWPQNKISELITRLILNTTGSAFAKLQLHHTELCVNDPKQVEKLIELLGGHWGKTGLEKRYADAEKALFQCNQQPDESHDSYLARADVLWTKLKSQKLKIEDLQAYITLRGAQLSSDDKKRIILDSDSSLEGSLTVGRVQEAVRMLGTSFFQEMTGGGKKLNKSKVYDSLTMFSEDQEVQGDHEESAHAANHEDWTEEDMLEVLIAEGDDDAVFISDFESAASELVQSDEDLAAAYSTYVEARRKLSEKYRSRGFWPISNKGKSRGKGKTKGKQPWNNRKSLQQRILESNCRLCGKRGHWRNECPLKNQSSTASQSSAAVTVSLASHGSALDSAMPSEFMNLPEAFDSPAKDILIEMKLQQQAKSTSLPSAATEASQRILRSGHVRVPMPKAQSVANLAPVEQESIDHLTVADLQDEPMTFGKSHLGKPFGEMWSNHPDWIRWFAAHYHTSNKIEHRKMIHFINLKIEEAESQAGPTQLPVPKAKSIPKSLAAKPKSVAAASTTRSWEVDTESEMFEMMSEVPWVSQEETKAEIQNIHNRMANLESTLQQMMTMISHSPMMMNRNPPMTVSSAVPETTVWDEGEPWNN
eukprot:s557_g9.t1